MLGLSAKNKHLMETIKDQTSRPFFKYGFLAFIIILVAWNIYRRVNISPSNTGEPNGNLVISLMLLLNHLAFQYEWRESVSRILNILAWAWIVFGLFYIIYWADVLYPL